MILWVFAVLTPSTSTSVEIHYSISLQTTQMSFRFSMTSTRPRRQKEHYHAAMRTCLCKFLIQTMMDLLPCKLPTRSNSQDLLSSCSWWSKTCQAMPSPRCLLPRFQCCLHMSQNQFSISLSNRSSHQCKWNCLSLFHGRQMLRNWFLHATPLWCLRTFSSVRWKNKDSVPKTTLNLIVKQKKETLNLKINPTKKSKIK